MATSAQENVRPKRVEIRGFEPEDYPRMVEIDNLLYSPHRWTVEEARYEDEHFDKKYFFRRWAAEDPASHGVVGIAELHHMPWSFHTQKFWMNVAVHPEWQRQGIGQAMYAEVLAELAAKDAIIVRSSARKSMAHSIRWLEGRGFREKLRNWESHLDVASVDAARFAEKARVPEGIEIRTLDRELAADPGCLQAIFDMTNEIGPDIPSPDAYTAPTYDMFLSHLHAPGALPDAYFVAKAGDRYVGISNLWRSEGSPDALYQGLTGVIREYRGRGIAWALKMRTIAYARDNRYRQIRTWNNTENRHILNINEALGFAKQPVWITFERDLARGATG
jgi:ribosomal protein S18 acetylase RimI-like enzyme